ncbi:MAG: divergent polysaccharide deacetylase family protein [Deltaproteobacteria bacterium]|nr:divergent polysaccharide deacetylase family protein [Deltaproteobacteria bacterium]
MKRRTFLLNSASLLFNGLLEVNGLSKAFGFSDGEPKPLPRIAIIIDDIGFSRSLAKRFLDLRVPITFAILPKLERSSDLAEEIHALGHEIILHQPMEAHDSKLNPGPGALFVGYGAERIAKVVRENIAGVPYALGVNNHMGSRLTECREEINQVLNVIEYNSLFFVDSITSSRSIAYQEASRRGIPSAFRNIFLDNFRSDAYIINQLRILEKEAFKYGRAVGIGHPFPETARAISRFLSGCGSLSEYLVPISAVLKV